MQISLEYNIFCYSEIANIAVFWDYVYGDLLSSLFEHVHLYQNIF